MAAVIIAGPEPERDGVCAWTRADLCRWLEERFAKTYHPSSMTRVLRRMGFSRQKARPSHPRRDAEAQDQKRGLRDILKATAAAHPANSCGFRMKRASATRAGCVTGGGAGASVPVGLHLLRRAPGHRRRRHPGDAERQRQGHGPVSRTLRRYPGPGCARRHDVRRRRLARRARPHRPRQRHLGAVAARSASSTTPRPSSTPVAKLIVHHRRTHRIANPLRLPWIMKVIS